MFVGDLPERIRKQPSNESFPRPFDGRVAGLAGDEDLRRFCTTPVLRAAMSKRLEMVRLLIGRGADVNVTNRHANSPLLYAAADGDVKMTRALLDAGADVNAPDGAGCSPLCFALRFSASGSHLQVVELLKSRGAVR